MTLRYMEVVEPPDVSPISSRNHSPRPSHEMPFSEIPHGGHRGLESASSLATKPSLEMDSFQNDKGNSGIAWESKNFRRFPWSALWALFLAAGATFACIAILVGSDGKSVEDWPISPSVWLAILSATANASLRYALSEAVNIAWWSHALKGGTIQELQYWLFGTSLYAATTAGRKFNLIALASIAVTAVAIDGALLQRASTATFDYNAYTKPVERQVNATIATHLPFGYSGFEVMSYQGSGRAHQAYLRDRFQSIMDDYANSNPIDASGFTGCRGTCAGHVKAAGLFANCSQSNMQRVWNSSKIGISGSGGGTAFSVDFSWSGTDNNTKYYSEPLLPVPDDPTAGEPFIQLDITYSEAFSNANESFTNDMDVVYSGSNITSLSCKLYSATKEYPIIIGGDFKSSSPNQLVGLSGSSMDVKHSVQNLKQAVSNSAGDWNLSGTSTFSTFFKDPAPDTENTDSRPDDLRIYETLSGLASSAQDLFKSDVSLQWDGNNSANTTHEINFFGSLAMQSLRQDSPGLNGSDSFFGLSFEDPSSRIFRALDEIMFRAAVDTTYSNTMEFANRFLNFSDQIVSTAAIDGAFIHNLKAFPKPQLITMQETRQVQVFESHYKFLGIAMGVMFFAASVIAPIFNGFWRLGRQTSLSPFETAKAFGAPIFDEGGSNASAKQLVKEMNVGPVRYGEIISSEHEYGVAEGGVRRRRLGIAATDRVIEPERGALYH